MAAATMATRLGLSVEMIEQRRTLGGAFFRQPIAGVAPIPQRCAAKARWQRLSSAIAQAPVRIHYGCVFLGIDSDGFVLVDDRQAGEVVRREARAVIIAVGAIEKVRPIPGWDRPGVSTAGGIQVMMKETGRAPKGRVLLAGNGPLLIAAAAQMTAAGNPPVAIVEAADPMRPSLAGLGLLAAPYIVAEAFGYLKTVYAAGVPWLRGARLEGIEPRSGSLKATVIGRDGVRSTFEIDRVGLHEGIRSNDMGLPANADGPASSPVVVRAGDCSEALGSIAAEADGALAARKVGALLGYAHTQGEEQAVLVRHRKVQAALARVFAPTIAPVEVPDHTTLCRCEGKTIGDLKHLLAVADMKSGREVKHNGRFSMGACQGRFCAANTAELMTRLRPAAPPVVAADLTGHRWPLRPVSIAALVAAAKPKPAVD
jgi:hypothetical protein